MQPINNSLLPIDDVENPDTESEPTIEGPGRTFIFLRFENDTSTESLPTILPGITLGGANLSQQAIIGMIIQDLFAQTQSPPFIYSMLQGYRAQIEAEELTESQFCIKLSDQIVKTGKFFIQQNLYSKDEISLFLGSDYVAVMNNALFATITTLFKLKEGKCLLRASNLEVTTDTVGSIVYSHIENITKILEKYAKLSPRAKAALKWHLCCDEEKVQNKLNFFRNSLSQL